MVETSQTSHPSPSHNMTTRDSAESAASAPAQTHDFLQLGQNSMNPVANRVGTPLGLFVQSSNNTVPMSMPQTVTPESASSASPPKIENTAQSILITRQTDTSPTRPRILPSDCMRKRTESPRNTLHAQSNTDDNVSPLVPDGEMAPLHTGMVQANTKMVHPKPITRAPVDVTSRPGTASSVVQLERTAQQLSMTSSIDNAIRDLHGELKRSDSRRSSMLAASVKNADDAGTLTTTTQVKRHLSTSSSIVSTNIAARQGGYSPAAFVMSPSASITGRLIPGSMTPVSHPETDAIGALSRHGPGKSSVRSVRSAKMSLADISEFEPISLTQAVLDEADNALPIELEPAISEDWPYAGIQGHQPTADAFDQIMQGAAMQPVLSNPTNHAGITIDRADQGNRPSSTHSQDTYHQAQHAFYDFDGVHCPEYETEANDNAAQEPILTEERHAVIGHHLGEDDFDLPPLQFPQQSQASSYGENHAPPPPPVGLVPPQSYIDPVSGVQMNYYPARVPAALNIPQKLSNRPKANQRILRHSKVLSAMMDGTHQPMNADATRRGSVMPTLGSALEPGDQTGPRPTKERHHERRPSFLPLSTEDLEHLEDPVAEPPAVTQESHENLAATLRIPKRISEPKGIDKRKSRMSLMGNIPSALRASAFFDSSTATTDLEAKNGSAMNALDDVLDAAAGAPVTAFTDHLYAGNLGSEVYGTTKKSLTSSPSLRLPSGEHEVKKRSSFMWLSGRRSHSNNSRDSPKVHSEADSPRPQHDDDGDEIIRVPAGPMEHGEEGEHTQETEEAEEEEEFIGAPTTLLAEIQLRKQQQKDRIQNRVQDAQGMQATLLELDAIAETQRIDRKSKRVNLVWEDPAAHLDQNGSDDEDVPLAIIAARQQGAKNMADLERPLGLIEKREIEENEPLSRRRARLQGLDDTFSAPRPQSMLVPRPRLGDTRPRQSMISLEQLPAEDVEGETLAERRKRLASDAEKEKEISLPPTRPVSTAFSAELLSQFDPPEAGRPEEKAQQKDVKSADGAPEEEETLGQRRRRLQAERTARQQEMAHGNAAASSGQNKDRRMSFANVLAAHPRKSPDLRVQQERQRQEEEERMARERDAKLAAMRLQMPSTLSVPSFGQQRGFNGGVYNNGNGGLAVGQQRPVSARVLSHNQFNRPSSMALNTAYSQQGLYMNPYAAGSANMFGAPNMYNKGGSGVYGGMQPAMQKQLPMQMPHNGASMDRVEMWRQGVFP